MNTAIELAGACLHIIETPPIVFLGIETGLVVITALDDVQGCTNTAVAGMHRSGKCWGIPIRLKRGSRGIFD